MRVVDDHGGPVTTIQRCGRLTVAVMDSIAFATPALAGQLIVTGSHGGTSAGEYAARCGVAAVACNDAGVGRHSAGVAGLAALDGVVAVAVSHDSARIGDGHDTWHSGVISFANSTALRANIHRGDRLRDAFTRLATRWAAQERAC